MQSGRLGEIEMFYLFQFPSSNLFQSFYFQQGRKKSWKNDPKWRRKKHRDIIDRENKPSWSLSARTRERERVIWMIRLSLSNTVHVDKDRKNLPSSLSFALTEFANWRCHLQSGLSLVSSIYNISMEKSALSPRQWTVSQVFSGSSSQRILTVCRPKKNGPGKEIGLQWSNDSRNCSIVWGQRKIVLQKRHRNVREALEWMYHSWRRLCWWMNFP